MLKAKAVFFGVLLSAALALSPSFSPAVAQQKSLDEAEEMAVEAIDRMMRALGLIIDSIPQYEAPEILPNGDIIIRRINPKSEPAPEGEEPEVDETST